MKPLALQMVTLRDAAAKDFFGTLKRVAEMGYAGVEFWGLYGHKPAEVRKALDDLGLKACSSHSKLIPGKITLEEEVEAARVIGYDLAVIPFIPAEGFAGMAKIKETAATLRGWAAKLNRCGLRMAYHNHTHDMAVIDGKHALEHLFELAVEVEAQVDIYWASNFGAVDVPAFIARHASRITTLHIKDGPLVRGQALTAAGGGKMDIAACIKAASPGVLQWLIVEIDECPDPMASSRESVRFLTSEGLAKGRD